MKCGRLIRIFTSLKPILEIKGISKKYHIHSNIRPYLSLRESAFSFLKPSSKKEEFWALQNVNFDVMQGDTIGIVGKNGAGKSTLLKILSKITPPTKGKITCRGRIASLLEVGTGFHPELSGKENIFLNGSILGMKRSEIQKQFDAIVDFSGVGKFIDTPLKHYSSGMQLRLAFSVAAFLEPEILIIDEVLAVGDAEFQKKCLGKMQDVSKSGRTILFVSHNIQAVQALCQKCVFLENGQVNSVGSTELILNNYFATFRDRVMSRFITRAQRPGNGMIRFTNYDVLNLKEDSVAEVMSGQSFILRLFFENNLSNSPNKVNISIGVDDYLGTRIAYLSNDVVGQKIDLQATSKNYFDVQINNVPLKRGSYSIIVFLTINEELADWVQSDILVDIETGDFYNTGKLPPEEQGALYLDYKFN